MKKKTSKQFIKQYKFLGEILAAERNNNLLYKQEDLAKKLGVQQTYISKVEAGKRRIDIVELRELCHALNISLVDLARKIESRFSAEFPESKLRKK